VLLGLNVCAHAQIQSAPEYGSDVTLSAQQKSALDHVKNGLRYEHAEGITRDLALAHDYYCQAARMDSSEGLIRLGWMYANGRGVIRNDSIANTLFQKAANLGDEMGKRLAEMIRAEREELPQCITSNKSALPTPLKKLGGESTSPATLSSLPALPKLPKPVAFSELSMADRGKFPRLVLAVMRAESNFDPLARSPKGAQGLMQLIPDTAERFGVKDSNDPGENIRGGMTYLKWLLSLFKGNVVLSLAAYNAGEKTIEKFNGVPPYPETMAYVQRIRSIYPADFHAFDERAAAYRTDKKKR
jgi:Transglycosylase SLT domain/Sel1 repeat